MAKFKCVCGEQITTSGEIPNPDQWLFISDVDFDKFTGNVAAEDIYREMKIMFRCPRSGHLYMYWDGFDEPPRVYGPLDIKIPSGG